MATTEYDFKPYLDAYGATYRDEYKLAGDDYKPIQYNYSVDGEDKSVNMYTDSGHYSEDFLAAQEEQGIKFSSMSTGTTPRKMHFTEQKSAHLDLLPEELSSMDRSMINMASETMFDRPFYNKKTGEQENPTAIFNYYLNEKQKLGAYVSSDVDPFAEDISGTIKLDQLMDAYIKDRYSKTPLAEDKIMDDMKKQESPAY